MKEKRAKQNKKEKKDKKMNGSRFYARMHRALAKFVLWLFRVRVHHAEREPEGENYLLCSNHLSALDPVVLSAALKKQQPHFMAKKELFRIPLLAGLIRSFGAFPVDRAGDVGAIKTSVTLLQEGLCVGMFPQGTRCPGKPLRETVDKVKNGAGLLVDKTHVTVLPVCLKTKKNRLKMFGGVDIIIGNPMSYEVLSTPMDDGAGEGERHSRQAEYARISHAVFEQICVLHEEGDAHEAP